MPTSFETTLYIPSLKISITAGTFVQYRRRGYRGHNGNAEGQKMTMQEIGRIISVVTTFAAIPVQERNRSFILNEEQRSSEEGDLFNHDHFAKVNLFKNCVSFRDSDFPDENCFSPEEGGGRDWQRIVQVDAFEWIPMHVIDGLSFVFMADNVMSYAFDDCLGMQNFFVLKYRATPRAATLNYSAEGSSSCKQPHDISLTPQSAHPPPFPGRIGVNRERWCVDLCELVFKSTRQIRRDIQRILCRIAQSQGEHASKNAHIQLPSCC